jgi:PBP1b-binding outer membrane lipoprotein LpoB
MRKDVKSRMLIVAICLFIASGCATYTTRVDNAPGRPTHYEDPGSPGALSGVGIESQDIISVSDRMMRDILSTPVFASCKTPPRVVIDSAYFYNESSSVVNKNLFTDRLRTELNRAANGRMIFLARHLAEMTENESGLEKKSVVTEGTQGPTKDALGWDYRLGGRIASIDATEPRTGAKSRYHQTTFELVERGSGVIVWSNTYEFKKSAQEDILYR